MTTRFESNHRASLLRRVEAEDNEFRAWQEGEERKGRDFQRSPCTLEERSRVPSGAAYELEVWDRHVVQIISAPPDMSVWRAYRCAGERDETVEEHPVVCLALQRDGRVVPLEIDPECGIIASNDALVAMADERVTYLISGKKVAEGKALS